MQHQSHLVKSLVRALDFRTVDLGNRHLYILTSWKPEYSELARAFDSSCGLYLA